MAHTLVAYSESQDNANVVNVAAVPDPHVTVQGDDILVPTPLNNLAAVAAVGVSITRSQVRSPSLLRVFPLEISPINVGAEPLAPTPFPEFFRNPIQLDPTEALNFQAGEDGAGATRENGLLWLTDGNTNPMSGEIFTIRGVGTTTVVAFAWSNVPLTLDANLPAGIYAVVGMRAEGATCIAARLVFVGGSWRPGVIGYDAVSDVENPIFRFGQLGDWGQFRQDQPPTADFFCAAADTAQVVMLDLLKIS